MSRTKLVGLGILGSIILLIAISFIDDPKEQQMFADAFMLNGVYHIDNQTIMITFVDTTNKTESLVLEVLGLEKSFQKKFQNTSMFVQEIHFKNIPKYGWKIHPIVIDLHHKEFGHIGVKTEVRTDGQSIPPVLRYRIS